MDGLNYGTYYFFRNMAKETPGLHGLMRGVDFLARLGVIAAVALVLIGVLLRRRQPRAAIVVLSGAVLGLLLIEGLNRAIGTPRPDEMDEAYAGALLGPAFASRAAFLSSFVYGLLPLLIAGFLPRRWHRIAPFALCVLLILGIGFSQLYLRVEYLTGLLAGWALGLFLLLLSWQLGNLSRPSA